MNGFSIRRIQAVCFALSHIPLAVVALVLLRDGAEGDWGVIGLAFGATVVTAVLLLAYLQRALTPVLDRRMPQASGSAG